MELDFIRQLMNPNKKTKIVLLVLDGVGGLPMDNDGPTELEAANTPHLDRLAAQSICGLHEPIGAGITPGSGPGHLALFGYDPRKYQIGRGVLSALGIGFDLKKTDVAARGNFCTLDAAGNVVDRRAGRIPTEKNKELLERLRQIELPDAEVFLKAVKDYRMLLVLRGKNLGADLADTDPQETGVPPLEPQARSPQAEETARLVEEFLCRTREILADETPANMLLLRGFAKLPDWPTLPQVYGLKSAAIASYPMYRGVARLVGMESLDSDGTLEGEFDILEEYWDDFDYFFVHVKPIDSAGEDGDFERKVRHIEEADAHIPRVLDLKPDVLVVTGDHSTPSKMKYHSWHPVPTLLQSTYCRPDNVKAFGERACINGGLGPRIPVTDLMPLAMAHAERLEKFGA